MGCLVCAIFPLWLTACERPGAAGVQEIIHPVETLRYSSEADVPVVPISHWAEATLPSLFADLVTFDVEAAVGTSGADDDAAPVSLVFGSLIDGELDANGNVLLLDADYQTVRILSPDLSPRQILGSQGEGPGEFTRPRSLLPTGVQEFAVLDGRTRRLERFRAAGNGYEAVDGTPLSYPYRPDDACADSGRIYVRGVSLTAQGRPLTEDAVRLAGMNDVEPAPEFIHVVDSAGEPIHSFSTPYRDIPHAEFAVNLSETGGLVCDRGRVWVAYGLLGEVHSHAPDGELQWIVRIADLAFPGVLYRWSPTGEALPGSRGLAVDVQAGNYSVEGVSRLTLLSESALAIGVERSSVGDPSEGYPRTSTHRTYLVDPATGSFLGSFEADHEILAGRDGRVLLYRDHPFPQVSLVRIGG